MERETKPLSPEEFRQLTERARELQDKFGPRLTNLVNALVGTVPWEDDDGNLVILPVGLVPPIESALAILETAIDEFHRRNTRTVTDVAPPEKGG